MDSYVCLVRAAGWLGSASQLSAQHSEVSCQPLQQEQQQQQKEQQQVQRWQ
jgi:hypothetical protein